MADGVCIIPIMPGMHVYLAVVCFILFLFRIVGTSWWSISLWCQFLAGALAPARTSDWHALLFHFFPVQSCFSVFCCTPAPQEGSYTVKTVSGSSVVRACASMRYQWRADDADDEDRHVWLVINHESLDER
ncbi:uncharacterized protein EI90DRAFT_3057400 [Cantharellus anzutake]|uniref:uncharacterized protein n=1 Tax=Cantharellus anzutake TaxID=1750568 RepID=UPI0019042999|nr:uncharacterized protein EI90DRAFT_3057400 [Cantharellus anzutake]KAF8331284.1 hypothetical protein EI90DRAFT_3057400 [Cantharellus anzutake]